jgi:hypothetical protein
MPDEVKGTVFRKNRMRDPKLAYDEQITHFLVIFNLKGFFAYRENTQKSEKSLNNLSPLILEWSKTISRYCQYRDFITKFNNIPFLGNRENRERTKETGEGENLTAHPGVTPVVRLDHREKKIERAKIPL